MARVSFTVRNVTAGSAGVSGGSFLRYPDGSASPGIFPTRNYDSALRDAGLQIAPASFPASTFSAIPITYGTVELDWQISINSTPTLIPSITSMLLVYSPVGVPQTILSGVVIADTATSFSYVHTGLTQGQWAYYGLFAHFTTSDGSSDFYEKLAELEIIVPNDYGSTLRLWKSLPQHVRADDVARGNYNFSTNIGFTTLNALGYAYDVNGNPTFLGDPIGPLLKFLSIIGFDMDGIRTLVDYLMVAKDPLVANSQTLDAMAKTMGVDVAVANLGDARLRNVLNNIGVYRRSKGTISAMKLYMNAVTGTNITVNTATKAVTIQSTRANYITVPKDGNGITTWRVSHSSEVATPLVFSSTTYNAFAGDVTNTGVNTWTLNANAHGITGAMIKLNSPVPVLLNDKVEFSVSSSTPNSLQWARLVDGSGNILGWGQVVKVINGKNYVEILINNNVTSATTFTNGFIEFRVDLTSSPFVGANYLAEANHLGDYFDGSTVRGGWLVDSSSISDFRWIGSANNSVSVYAEDYSRTSGVAKDVFLSTVPITEESKYSITVYNSVRGF